MGRLKTPVARLRNVSSSRVQPPSSGSFGDRGSTTARGYGWSWQQQRLRILRRDGYRCVECTRQDRLTAAVEVDHIVEKADGGTDDDANLQSLCTPCHETKTEASKAARRAMGLPP